MDVCEIFASIQGESTRAGERTAFVRLAGCNLDCTWCDTPQGRAAGFPMDLEDIVGEALGFPGPQVCITGGEPLLQAETPDLLKAFLVTGRTTVLMTNGSLPMDNVPEEVISVVDIKSPWSQPSSPGESTATLPQPPHFHSANLSRLGSNDEVKFVVRSRTEFDWACQWAGQAGLFSRVQSVLVSPAWGALEPALLAEWIMETRLPVRLNLQWHKVIWGEDTDR